MDPTSLRPDVFAYQRWRDYVRAWLRSERRDDPWFGVAALAAGAGLSAGTLRRALDHERELSAREAARLAEAMGLEGEAAAQLVDLVCAEHGDTPVEVAEAARRIAARRQAAGMLAIDGDFFALLSDPRLIAIYELAHCASFRADPAWVAEALEPPCAPDEAARLLETLLAMGALVRRADGGVGPRAEIAITGALLQDAALFLATEANLDLAAAALGTEAPPTLWSAQPRVRLEDLPALLTALRAARDEIVQILVEEAPAAQRGEAPAQVLAVHWAAAPDHPPLPPLLAGATHVSSPRRPARRARVRRA